MRWWSNHMGRRHIIILSFGCLTYLIFCDQIKCWKLNVTMQSLELPDTLNLNPMMIIIVIPCHSPSKWNWTCRLARSYRDFDCCSFDPAWSLQGESWNYRKQKLLKVINVSHKENLKLLFSLKILLWFLQYSFLESHYNHNHNSTLHPWNCCPFNAFKSKDGRGH